MTINFLSNSTASVLGAVASGGAQTQLTLTANAPFEVNELVFVDWKTGAAINLANTPVKSALATGPSFQTYLLDDFPGAAVNSVGGISQVGPDGSMYLLGSAYAGSGPYRRAIVLYKYSAKGVLLSKGTVFSTTGDSSSLLINTCAFALLSNGNILVTYVGSVNSTTLSYSILNSSMRTIFTGTIVGAAGSPAYAVSHIQATKTGGAILVTTSGIEHISAAGVASRPVVHISPAMAQHDHLKDQNLTNDVYLRPVVVKSGADGAFGYAYSSSANGYVGSFYAVIEADGTLRGAVVSLSATASGQLRVAVSPTTNNIMWAGSTSPYYGVITDAGAKLKDYTPITNLGTVTNAIRLTSDASGNFLLMTLNTTDFKWYLRYMTPAGADVMAAFSIGSLNGNQPGLLPLVAKLSTGTVYILPSTTGLSTCYYAFVNIVGAVVTSGLLVNFGISGSSGMNLTVTVYDDTVYGAGTVASSGMPTDMSTFIISNVGAVILNGDPIGGVSGRTAFDVSYPMRAYVDESGDYLYVVGTTYGSSYVAVMVYDLSLNLLSYTMYTILNQALFIASTFRVYGQGLLATGAIGANESGATGVLGVYFKPKTTMLLGVAANSAAKGAPVTVNTKGIFPVAPGWRAAAQTFDSSANVPAGNAGTIGGGYINLKGF
jgi:hypothetical protein